MDNIILQHFDGKLPDWARAAEKTVSRYSLKINADYELITGMPCGDEAGPYAQKMHMLDEKYDGYEEVLMLDMDVIATNIYANIFNIPQIGVLHSRAMIDPNKVRNQWHNNPLYKQSEFLFFGSVIKLKREQRQELRKYLDWNYIISCKYNSKINYNRPDFDFSDEIILHYLLHKSKILEGKSFYEVCMRRDGKTLEDIHVRNYDRYDRKFANQPEDSDPDASLIHFCGGRKSNILPTIKNIFKGQIL